MAKGNPLWINLNAGTGNLEMTQDTTGTNNKELIPKAHILGVFPVKLNKKPNPPDDQYWIYPYDNMTVVCLRFRGDERPEMRIELQDASNQSGWSTGTQAGINQCVADFGTFL